MRVFIVSIMTNRFILWTFAVILLAQFLVRVADGEEATLRCSRCPAQCTSAHTYQLSCHNACRSVSPRLTQVRCDGNRCVCNESATTTTTAPTTTKKKKIFG